MSNRLGQQLGNYRLVQFLGQGGFADVYLGVHIYLGTQAALKVIRASIVGDDIEHFQKEARMIAHLIHPHIVRVLEFGVQDTVPFLVLDYAPGGSLRTLHPKGRPLPLDTVRSYVDQVAAALQHAHQQKIIHRDVKPENMLMGKCNEVLLNDFGIALIAQSSHYQSAKDIAGTVAYMAPEQIASHPQPASDQYSLGIVVYEWLTGDCPFHGSFTEVAVKHGAVPPPSLREKVPTIPFAVEQVVLKALAKDPNRRFGCISDFAVAFAQACHPQRVLLESEPPVREHRVSRRIFIDIGLAALAGLATEGAIGWIFMPHRNPSPRPAYLYAYEGHSSAVWSVAWSPDGKRIASASGDETVQVWNALNGGNPYTYKGHSSTVYAVAWSPDGKYIASADLDGIVQVWNAAGGAHRNTYRGHSRWVRAVSWSPDGKRIASAGGDNNVQVWNANNGDTPYTYQGHTYSVFAVAWSPDGKRIASASGDKTVQVWDAVDGGNPYTYKGHSSAVNAVAWSPDGKRIASAGDDKTVQVWDAVDGGNPYTYKGHVHPVWAVAWSPDGKRIASASADDTVQVWDATNGTNAYTYKGHTSWVFAAAWSPDGKRIASASNDASVQVWQPM